MKEGKEQRKVVKNDERRRKKEKVEKEGVTISENLQDPAQ